MRRFSDPIVFLKLEVSCVFADSPIARCFWPKPTKDLKSARIGKREQRNRGEYARRSTIRNLVGDNIDASMSCDTNLHQIPSAKDLHPEDATYNRMQGTQVDSNDGHGGSEIR